MTRTTKSLQDLTIRDNFLFDAVMMDEEICRHTIELALGFPIERISVVRERSLQYHPEYHGIRLDIYAQDENHTHYNVEMQVVKKTALVKRSRYYHSQMDMEMLAAGMDYTILPACFVIFICCFDPFGEDRYRYTFMNQCTETGQSAFDGAVTIYLNTEGKHTDSVSPELISFLQYVKDSSAYTPVINEDSFLQKIEESIRQIKASREMGDRYMLFELIIQEEREEARREGFSEGHTTGHAVGHAEGHAKGHAEGRSEGHLEGCIETVIQNIFTILEELGEIPSGIRELVLKQTDLAVLKQWFKIAVRSDSIDAFSSEIQDSITK